MEYFVGSLMRPEHSKTKAKTETRECETETETKNYETETETSPIWSIARESNTNRYIFYYKHEVYDEPEMNFAFGHANCQRRRTAATRRMRPANLNIFSPTLSSRRFCPVCFYNHRKFTKEILSHV